MTIKYGETYSVEQGQGRLWAWSPDGEGVYWYDTLIEMEEDNPDTADWPFFYFFSPRSFDDYRYGPVV